MPNPTIEIRKHENNTPTVVFSDGVFRLAPGTYGLYDPATQRVVEREKVDAMYAMLPRIDTVDECKPSEYMAELLTEAGLGKEQQ